MLRRVLKGAAINVSMDADFGKIPFPVQWECMWHLLILSHLGVGLAAAGGSKWKIQL